MHNRPASSAHVDLVAQVNASFRDSIQFDPPVAGVTRPAWSLTGQTFRMDIRPDYGVAALLSITSAAGQIVVDDVTQRIIHFNVNEATMSAAGLIPGCYVYDLIMIDASVNPNIRVPLMHGKFEMNDGVTGG